MLDVLLGEYLSFCDLHLYLYIMGWRTMDSDVPMEEILKSEFVSYLNITNYISVDIEFEPITPNYICITGIKYYE